MTSSIGDAVSRVLEGYDWTLVMTTTKQQTPSAKHRTHVKRPMNGKLVHTCKDCKVAEQRNQ